jgi:hypothetical protein
MIKFFRKIRQKLLNENKFSKYLIYAIGEIILVVIGILIALSINNWNENRKLQKEELNLLLELKSNLEVTLYNFKKDTLSNSNTIHEFKKIESYIKEDLPYNSELDFAFRQIRSWWSPYPIYTAYTTLKTKGLDIISNVPLRNKIVNLYEYDFMVLNADYDKGEWTLFQTVVNPFYSKFIRIDQDSNKLAIPNDFESLKNNDEFINILRMISSNRRFGLIKYKSTMISIENLIKSIDNELNSRK